MGWVSEKWYHQMVTSCVWRFLEVHKSAWILAYCKGQCPREAIANTSVLLWWSFTGHGLWPQIRTDALVHRQVATNDCPGEHHVAILWVEMLEPQTRPLEQIASPQRSHAIWDASSWWQAVWRTAKRFSKWCSTLPVASGRTQRLACRGDTPRHRHQAFAPKSAE